MLFFGKLQADPILAPTAVDNYFRNPAFFTPADNPPINFPYIMPRNHLKLTGEAHGM